jgi:hypothetical protein
MRHNCWQVRTTGEIGTTNDRAFGQLACQMLDEAKVEYAPNLD